MRKIKYRNRQGGGGALSTVYCLLSTAFLVFLSISALSEASAEVGTIGGRVTFEGEIPKTKVFRVTIDKYTCGAEKPSQELIISPDRGIKNALLWIEGTPAKRHPSKSEKDGFNTESSYRLDQQDCEYVPHVLVVPPEVALKITNSDPIAHNVHTISDENPSFNKFQKKNKLSVVFQYPEIIQVECNMHSWMKAWIVVADSTYYALTDKDGSFKIENIPPGTYKLRLWHESLGENVKEVVVKSAEDLKVDFKLSKRSTNESE